MLTLRLWILIGIACERLCAKQEVASKAASLIFSQVEIPVVKGEQSRCLRRQRRVGQEVLLRGYFCHD